MSTQVTSTAEALDSAKFDVALFALKSFDTESALSQLKAFPNLPPILCLQNGVDNEPMIAAALGADKLIYGTVTSAVGRPGPGNIVLEKLRGVGVADGHPLSRRLAGALDDALLNCQLFPVAADMKWSKMLTNLLANPTSAILNMTAAEVFAHPGLYRLEIAQLCECLDVMAAQGIKVVDLPGTPVRALAFATKLPLWLSKPFLSKAAGAGRGATGASTVTEPGSDARGAGLAGLAVEIARGALDVKGKRIVAICTGHGMKDPDIITRDMQKPLVVPPKLSALEEVLLG